MRWLRVVALLLVAGLAACQINRPAAGRDPDAIWASEDEWLYPPVQSEDGTIAFLGSFKGSSDIPAMLHVLDPQGAERSTRVTSLSCTSPYLYQLRKLQNGQITGMQRCYPSMERSLVAVDVTAGVARELVKFNVASILPVTTTDSGWVEHPDWGCTVISRFANGAAGAPMVIDDPCSGEQKTAGLMADDKLGGVFVMARVGTESFVRDIRQDGPATLVGGPFADVKALDIDPGGQFLVVVGAFRDEAAVWRLDVGTGAISRLAQVNPESLSISGDGKWLLMLTRNYPWDNIVRRPVTQ